MPDSINKITKYVCSLHPDIDEEKYLQQISVLYGALSDTSLSDPALFHELIEIEEERISTRSNGVEARIADAVALLSEYSKISFSLAQKSLFENKSYGVAQLLKQLLNGLLASGSISQADQRNCKMLVSETELDYVFASGNHGVSSLRMAQIIRDYKNNGGKQ